MPAFYRFTLVLVLLLAGRPVTAQDLTVVPETAVRLPGAVTALGTTEALLLAGDAGGRAAAWTLGGAAPVLQVEAGAPVVFVGATGGDSALVVVDAKGGIGVHALPGGAVSAALQAEAAPVRAAMDAGRRLLAVGNAKEHIELFDLHAGRRVGRIDAREVNGEVVFLGFDRLGQQLVVVTERGEVVSWNPVTLQPLRRLRLQGGSIHGSRTRIHAVAAGRSAHVFVVGLEEVALPKGGVGSRTRPGDLARRDLVVAYDWDSGIELRRIEVAAGPVARLALGPGTDYAAAADPRGGTVRFLHLRDGTAGAAVTVEGAPAALLVADDGDRLVIGTAQGGIHRFRLVLHEAPLPEEALPTLAGRIRSVGEDAPALTPERPTVLAVLPFEDRLGAAHVAGLVTEALTTRLANVAHLTLVERLRIDALLAEFALQEQGLTVEDGLEAGRLLQADYVLLGSLGALGPNYLFTARLLHVETGQVVSGRQVLCEACRQQDLFDAIDVLGGTIAR